MRQLLFKSGKYIVATIRRQVLKKLTYAYHLSGAKDGYTLYKKWIFQAGKHKGDVSGEYIFDCESQDCGTSQLSSRRAVIH